MTHEEHEEYKARLLQENKEYQQYEMGDFIIADEDGEKWIAKIRPTHYGVKTPDLYVKVPDRQARLWENAKKLLEQLKKTSALLKATMEISDLNVEIKLKMTDGKEILFETAKVLEDNTQLIAEIEGEVENK